MFSLPPLCQQSLHRLSIKITSEILGLGLFFSMIFFSDAVAQTASDLAHPKQQPITGIMLFGETFQGNLQHITSENQQTKLTFQSASQTKTIPLNQFYRWGNQAAPAEGERLLLVDGSLLIGRVIKLQTENLSFYSPTLGMLTFPLDLVRGILFYPPKKEQTAQRLLDEMEKQSSLPQNLTATHLATIQDQFWLKTGLPVTGNWKGTSKDQRFFLISSTGEKNDRQISRQQVSHLIFNPALAFRVNPKKLKYTIGLTDGSLLVCQNITLQNSGKKNKQETTRKLSFTLSNQKVIAKTIATGQAFPVCYLKYHHRRLQFLSDLQAASYQFTPFLNLRRTYYPNRNVLGGPLISNQKRYLSGIGMQSHSQLTFNLPKQSQFFLGKVALDDAAGNQGSVIFRIQGKQSKQKEWKLLYNSPVVRSGRQQAIPFKINVQQFNQIRLEVDFADRGDLGDYANWLEVRIVTSPKL